MTTTKRFIKRIEDFTCANCKAKVEGNGYTNHCPQCLWSMHVDIHPGDRASICRGLMEPIAVARWRGIQQITHRCRLCEEEKKCKVAKNDSPEAILDLVRKMVLDIP